MAKLPMESDQIWESVIQRTEHELLEPDNIIDLTAVKSCTAPQLMSAHDITSFIEVTALSHGCDSQNISFYYEPIIGDDGCISFDELFLVFSMKSLIDGELIDRPIHTIRVAIPQEVQQRARAMLGKDIRPVSVSPAPVAPASAPATIDSAPKSRPKKRSTVRRAPHKKI